MNCTVSNSNRNGECKGTEDNLDNSHLNMHRSFLTPTYCNSNKTNSVLDSPSGDDKCKSIKH